MGHHICHTRDDSIYTGDFPPLDMLLLDKPQQSRIDVAIETYHDHTLYTSRDDQGHMRYNLIHISHMYPLISYGLILSENRRKELVKHLKICCGI